MTAAFKREWLAHYYRMGATLAKTAGWTVDRAARHAELIGLGTLERAQVILGVMEANQERS